jgi:SAM-dependent methyltransferase
MIAAHDEATDLPGEPIILMRIADLMNQTWAYRAWQTPFAESKLRPLMAHTDLSRVRRVLDVGCGPGTNAHHFANVDYVGLDINPGYIAHARRRFGRDFRVADVTSLAPGTLEPADMILVNSLIHHLDDAEAHRTLAALPPLLAPGGSVHILDLVLPERASIARAMALLDRGRYPRSVAAWRSILTAHFAEQIFEPYAFGGLWSMVYFRGSARPLG